MSTLNKKIVLFGCLLFAFIFSLSYFILQTRVNTKIVPRRVIPTSIQATPTLPALFFDNFTDNSQNWDVGSGPGYSSTISNGTLTMTETNHKVLRELFPSNTTYDDFRVTVSFTLLQGDQNDKVSLCLRATGDTGQGYYIDIYGNDTYDIVKVGAADKQKPQIIYLVSPTNSLTLRPKGQQNVLAVIMKGPNIVLLINDSIVHSVSDNEFTDGKLMLLVENGNSSNGVTAAFDSVAVYAAPESLSG